MNYVVTGASGFIGKHLTRKLLSEGNKVYGIDINYPPTEFENNDSYIHIDDDICSRGMWPPNIDTAFHLAAVSRTVPAIENPIECMRTNVLGTCTVLEEARRNKVRRVVVASSNVVLAGKTAYRDSKRCVEDLCDTYTSLYDQSIACLRFSNVYGPGIVKWDNAVFAMLRDNYLEKGYAEVTGDGTQTRDFTHVYDIVNACIRSAALPKGHKVNGAINLCTEVQTSINDACKMLRIPVRYIEDRPGDVKFMKQTNSDAKEILGWEPTIEIEDGIRDIWSI